MNNDGEYSDHGFIITKASNMQCNSIYILAQICCREAKVEWNIWGGREGGRERGREGREGGQPDIIFKGRVEHLGREGGREGRGAAGYHIHTLWVGGIKCLFL